MDTKGTLKPDQTDRKRKAVLQKKRSFGEPQRNQNNEKTSSTGETKMIIKNLCDNISPKDPNKDPRILCFHLAQHGTKITQTFNELSGTAKKNLHDDYKKRMVTGIHSLIILLILMRPQTDYSGFINLLNSIANSVYQGELLIPKNNNCSIPPSDIREILDRKGLQEILSGYFNIIDSFYSEENKS